MIQRISGMSPQNRTARVNFGNRNRAGGFEPPLDMQGKDIRYFRCPHHPYGSGKNAQTRTLTNNEARINAVANSDTMAQLPNLYRASATRWQAFAKIVAEPRKSKALRNAAEALAKASK